MFPGCREVMCRVANHHLKTSLFLLLRIGLCVAALAYVISRTDIHDTVWLKDANQPVRLLSLEPQVAKIAIDGSTEMAVPVDALRAQPDGSVEVSWGLASLAQRSDLRLLLLAIAIYIVQPGLQIVRFRWMLRLQGISADWAATTAVCLVGNFYNYVIPGTTGGDVVRAGYLMRGSTNRHGAVAAIVLDRFSGMAGIFALAALAGLVIPDDREIVRYIAATAGAAALAMAVGFVGITGWPVVGRLLARLPLGGHLRMLYEAASVGRRGWAWLAGAVGVTIVLQGGSMVAFSVAAVALGMEPAWSSYFVCLPISLVVASIPIVPMGLGTMEAAMVTLLAGSVGSPSQVLGLAFTMRIIGLLWALPGGLLSLVWMPAPAVASSER